MSNKIVATKFNLGGTVLDGYTMGEPDPKRKGAFINYMSGSGAASAIILSESTMRSNRLPKPLKEALGGGFTMRSRTIKMAHGGALKIHLRTVREVIKYWQYHARYNNNPHAWALLEALSETTLDIIINDAFGRDYEHDSARKWASTRLKTKKLYEELSAGVHDYRIRVGKDPKSKFAYINIANQMNRGLFGKEAKTIREELGLGDNKLNRDYFGQESLRRIDFTQTTAVTQITKKLMVPKDAVEFALDVFCYEPIDYKL